MLLLGLTLITSWIISFLSLPSIIRFARQVNIFDEPGERKIHPIRVPLLGGLSIFAATLFSFTIFAAPYFQSSQLFIIAALIILFFLGLRDDMLPVGPVLKICGQAVAAILVVLFADIRIYGLHGFFGMHALLPGIAVCLSILIILFIINAYNLIDGIDGLASGIGIIASASFGILFFSCHEMLMSVLAISLCGALLGFIPYNFSRARIFMGDTGTMTVGFILAIFSIYFTEHSREINPGGMLDYRYAPVIVLAILIIPLMDTVRVLIIRLVRGRSPFSADRNHIHHKLLELGFSSAEVSWILYGMNIFFIGLAYLLKSFDPTLIFYLLVVVATLLTQLPELILRIKFSGKSSESATRTSENGYNNS